MNFGVRFKFFHPWGFMFLLKKEKTKGLKTFIPYSVIKRLIRLRPPQPIRVKTFDNSWENSDESMHLANFPTFQSPASEGGWDGRTEGEVSGPPFSTMTTRNACYVQTMP